MYTFFVGLDDCCSIFIRDKKCFSFVAFLLAYAASYPRGTGDSFLEGKAAGA
jgi:hypothetical protein